MPFSQSTPLDFEAVPLRAVTVGEGWDATHRLAADASVERAEAELHDLAAASGESDSPGRAVSEAAMNLATASWG